MNVSSIRENTKLAMDTLVTHRFRAALTILGVFIGVLVIVLMAAVLNGFRQTVVDQTEGFGTRNIYLWRYPFIQMGRMSTDVLNRKPLTLEDAKAIEQGVDAAEYVAPGMAFNFAPPGQPPPIPPEIKYRDRSMSRPQVLGGFPIGEVVMNATISQGRYFNNAENEHRAYVCVLGFNIVEALFPAEDPIGKTINCLGQEFTIVGTLAKLRAGPFGSENPDDNNLILPYWTLHKMQPQLDDHFIVVRMREGRIKEGIEKIEQVLRMRRGVPLKAENDFQLETSDSFIKTFDDIIGGVFMVMLLISSIAFIVGGVGVMNIMLVAVTERTREIGIRKAVGARRSDIVWQFLTEAVTLTGCGGTAGLLLGWFISWGTSQLVPDLSMVIPLWAAALGFVGSVGVGIVFGLWPAMKASRLDPITALRRE
jgi:putative ABC transport system permease protein